MDGDVLNKAVQNPSALSDAQKSRVNIAVNQSDFARYQQHTGAEQGTSSTRVQMHQDDGLVKVPGTPHEVRPEVLENLRKSAPHLFVEPEVKAQAAAKVDAEAAAEETTREELNRHPGEIEGYHQHITGEVSQQNQIALMVYGQKGEAPPESLIQNIAREMGEPVGVAVDKINLVSQGVQAQFTVLAKSMGLDADKAADWIKDHRKDTAMVAAQAHFMRRDLMAWKPLLADYQAATGEGRKH
jgi:hypothetical protein